AHSHAKLCLLLHGSTPPRPQSGDGYDSTTLKKVVYLLRVPQVLLLTGSSRLPNRSVPRGARERLSEPCNRIPRCRTIEFEELAVVQHDWTTQLQRQNFLQNRPQRLRDQYHSLGFQRPANPCSHRLEALCQQRRSLSSLSSIPV